MQSKTVADYFGPMTPDKAARLITGMTTEAVVLGITGTCSLIRDHTITPTGPLPSSVILEALADRIRVKLETIEAAAYPQWPVDRDPSRHCFREASPSPACSSCGFGAAVHSGCDCEP